MTVFTLKAQHEIQNTEIFFCFYCEDWIGNKEQVLTLFDGMSVSGKMSEDQAIVKLNVRTSQRQGSG